MNIEENQQALVPAEGNLVTLRLKQQLNQKQIKTQMGFGTPSQMPQNPTNVKKTNEKQRKWLGSDAEGGLGTLKLKH